MPKFVFLYRGGAPQSADTSPRQVQQHIEKWWNWTKTLIDEGLFEPGSALVREGCMITGNGIIHDGAFEEFRYAVCGYSTVHAASLDQAAEMARTCPILEFNGLVEIRPLANGWCQVRHD